MKPVCVSVSVSVVHVVLAALIVFAAGCASPSGDRPMRPPSADTDSYILHSPDGVPLARPPRLTVGVSDPDTQLILPWFLNDIINFVNYH